MLQETKGLSSRCTCQLFRDFGGTEKGRNSGALDQIVVRDAWRGNKYSGRARVGGAPFENRQGLKPPAGSCPS